MKRITTDDVRKMTASEGLVIQGCGGDLREWVDGINEILTNEGILLNGYRFENVSVFQNNGLTNLLFAFDEAYKNKEKINMGRLALWRIRSHKDFGGTWLSDYIENHIASDVSNETLKDSRPNAPIIGANGNIFKIVSIAARALKENNMEEQAKEMQSRVFAAKSYNAALGILMEYVTPVSTEDMEQMEEPEM